MTDQELRNLFDSLTQLVAPHLRDNEPARNVVGLLGKLLTDLAYDSQAPSMVTHFHGDHHHSEGINPVLQTGSVQAGPSTHGSSAVVLGRVNTPAAAHIKGPSAVVQLQIGDARVPIAVGGTADDLLRMQLAAKAASDSNRIAPTYSSYSSTDEAPELDLAVVEKRSMTKARACRAAVSRRNAAGDPQREADALKEIHEILDIVKPHTTWYMWPLSRERALPDDQQMERIAQAYEALSKATGLMRFTDELGELATRTAHEQVMAMLAQACSALRYALVFANITEDDRDQVDSYQWLRRRASIKRILIPRHMRLDDPADPTLSVELMERMEDFRKKLDERAKKGRNVRNEINRIRHHAQLIERDPTGDHNHDWTKIISALSELLASGLAPDDERVTAALLPVSSNKLPEDITDENLIIALRASDNLVEESDDEIRATRTWSDRVTRARELLTGKTVVLLGGEERDLAARRIKDAFQLDRLIWVPLTEHSSSETMRAPITSKETAAVIVMVRLSGHQHVDDAKRFARAADKPCVLLKAGYNPEQIAEAILSQASEQLTSPAAS